MGLVSSDINEQQMLHKEKVKHKLE